MPTSGPSAMGPSQTAGCQLAKLLYVHRCEANATISILRTAWMLLSEFERSFGIPVANTSSRIMISFYFA